MILVETLKVNTFLSFISLTPVFIYQTQEEVTLFFQLHFLDIHRHIYK